MRGELHQPVAGTSGRGLPTACRLHSGSRRSHRHRRPDAERRSECSQCAAVQPSSVSCQAAVVEAPPVPTHTETAAPAESFPRGAHWQVHKFGGTCLSDAERITRAAQLVADSPAESKAVVVSAMGSHPLAPVKVTDLLLNMVSKAASQDQAFLIDLAALQEKHVKTAKLLLGDGRELNQFVSRLLDDIANLKAMLQAISIAGVVMEAFTDFVVGHGELWSALLFAATLRRLGADAVFMDTRETLVVAPTSDGTAVDIDYEASNRRLDAWSRRTGTHQIVVATGFIAKTPGGQVTTLKRNGSDYSATIVGALMRSSRITIWTDVDGVFSADPRKVPESVCLKSLSYHEAWELSYFGASVLHPRTTMPAMKYSIPISIRNFFNQASPGTQISDERTDTEQTGVVMVKGFATIDNVALINVEGTGMVGVQGTASAIFTTVRDANVNVIMISQASSEHSVCFAVKQSEAASAVAALNTRFGEAIRAGRISKVEQIDHCCVLAAVGHQMASRKGVAATMFSALAKANINIRSIAQGCSEYNITVLINQADSVRALRAVHGCFFLAQLPIALGIVGPGAIGSTLLQQLHLQAQELKEEFDIDVKVLGIAGSRKMLLSDAPMDLATWREQYDRDSQETDLVAFADHLAQNYTPNTVIVDATASDGPPAQYLDWMRKGVHVITPNKKLNSGPLERYTELRHFQRGSYIHFLYEATVGAGLPVIATLKHLRDTGDRITRVEGIFSGTLSYIFNSFVAGTAFSDIVSQAKAQGFTEPDPRDDLAGMDVARKVTILARECGINMELDQVPVHSLVPSALQGIESVADFMQMLPEHDDDMAAQLADAEAHEQCLRFVGVVDCKAGTGSVELKRYPKSHAFAQLSGSDNIISFTTQRYSSQPLIVRGPGAGAEVTAGGVFSDLLRLAAYLGAPS